MDSHSTALVALRDFAIIVVLTLINATFSMAETALNSVRPTRVQQLVEEGVRGATIVKRLVEHPPRYFATTQVGITLLGFAAAATATATLSEPLIVPLQTLLRLGAGTAHTVAVAVITLLVALLTMILGEIAPKSLAARTPDVWALRLAPFINLCATLFTPLTSFVLGISSLLLRPFGAEASFEAHINREEIEHVISTGKKSGELDAEETTILRNVFDLSETPIRTVMTAREDITMLSVDADLPKVLETILESGHSRIPVYEETVDNIVGIIHAKDLLPLFRADEHNVDLRSVMRESLFVPRNKSVKDLLEEFRTGNQQLAIVVSDAGGTAGLVTLEDLLEEIVGEIHDEHDKDEPEIQKLSDTEYLIDGRMGINDVNDLLDIELPTTEHDQIGGLVFGMIGHSPASGDRVHIDGIDFTVESVERRRIRTLRALVNPTSGSEDAEEAALARPARGATTAGNGKSVEAVEPAAIYDMDKAAV